MNPFGSHLLSVIAYLPLVGGLILLVGFRADQKKAVARYATLIAGIDFLISLVLWFDWSAASPGPYGMRFVHQVGWIDTIGAQYLVGVDGISMLMVLLTTLLGFVAILSAWNASGLLKEHKVEDITITSGPNKALLNPMSPVDPEHMKFL